MRGHGEGSIYRRKDGRYEALIRYKDGQGRSQRARGYGRTEKQARQELRRMLRRIEDGDAVRDSTVTVESWCERWIETTLRASSRRLTTQQTYATLLRSHVVPRLGHRKLRDLTTAHVEDLIVDLRMTKSASTVRQVHLVLVMVLDSAVTHDLLRRNVARGVQRPPRERAEACYYSSQIVGNLRSAAHGHRLEPFLSLTAFTGLRKGEALALRWDDIVLVGETPHLRVTGTLARIGGALVRSDPKTASGRRIVPLVPPAVDALREAHRQQSRDRLAAGPAWSDTDYVFTTEIGTPIDPRNALRWFYTVRERVRIDLMLADPECVHASTDVVSGWTCGTCRRSPADYLAGSLHTLRYSAASVLLAAGVPMPIVKDVLGHSSIAVTVDLYGHMAPVLVAEAMNQGMIGYGIVS